MAIHSPRPALNPWLQRLFAVFGSGGIFVFYSEYVFVNEGPVRDLAALGRQGSLDALGAVAELFLIYGFFAYGFLIVLGLFRVSTIWSLFLAGVVLGWIIEGVVIPVVYESIPLSFAWTAIGWHATIDVLFGWYLVRRILALNRLALTAVLAAAIGLFWGYFATWTWASAGEVATVFSGADFAIFSFLATFILIGGIALLDRLGGTLFQPSRIEAIVVLGAMAVLAALMASTALPGSALLAPIVLVTFLALFRASKSGPAAKPLVLFGGPAIRWPSYALVLITPSVAALTYWVYLSNDIGLNVLIVAIPLVFGGVAMFAVSLVKAIWPRPTR